MATPYKLRCNIVGHRKDVRAVSPTLFPEQGILSGSRDVTARIWIPNEINAGFQEGHVMSGHSNFVASVCVMPPDDKHPQGLIFTGSNDATILAFSLDSTQPVYKLNGHNDTVCAMVAGKFGFLLSGSWDKTAKVWLNEKCVMTLAGHEAAVWAVALVSEHGLMLTGSADRTIKMWKAGKCERTFYGHDDCVRGLVTVNTNEFLSCSNDATVKRWLISGECLFTYYGHQNYVYSLALLPNGQDFVTSGEDRTVRVWKGEECVQTIPHPTESIWCVTALSNGDIVTGASDGIIRVFTQAPERMASIEEQKAYEEQLAACTIPAQVGDIKVNELPGPEALINPGRKDGQTKMIRNGDKAELYHWDAAESRWAKVGDIVGSAGGSQKTSGKTLFEGKEYDYVFSVDIEEGKPPLKLPYNITEDPWFAAQRFLERNDLSQMFLDQVANFITKNTEGVTLGTQQPTSSDPFTGGNRYVPGAAKGDGQHQQSGIDPFTGASSYKPEGAALPQVSSASSSFFPQTKFVTFDQANATQILGKLKSLNQTVEEGHRIEETELDSLSALIAGQTATAAQLTTMKKLLSWPPNSVFPALDILRIGVKQATVCQHICSSPVFLDELLKYVSSDNPTANQMLSLRVLANMFSQSEGVNMCCGNRRKILSKMLDCCKDSENKNIQIALATVILNFGVALNGKDDLESKSECLSAADTLMHAKLDPEALFRCLVCVGTLIAGDQAAKALVFSLNMENQMQRFGQITDPKKIGECASAVIAELSQ